jgi:hypothetical protein
MNWYDAMHTVERYCWRLPILNFADRINSRVWLPSSRVIVIISRRLVYLSRNERAKHETNGTRVGTSAISASLMFGNMRPLIYYELWNVNQIVMEVILRLFNVFINLCRDILPTAELIKSLLFTATKCNEIFSGHRRRQIEIRFRGFRDWPLEK